MPKFQHVFAFLTLLVLPTVGLTGQSAPASTLTRVQTSSHDIVVAQRPGSDITEILLSLPRSKYDYSANEYTSATIAVRNLSTRLTKRLSSFGAMVGYTDDHGTPTIAVTVLAEHAKVALPLVMKSWMQATYPPAAWKTLLTQEARRERLEPAELVSNALTELQSNIPTAKLKHDSLRFHVSRTLLVVGGPWSTAEVFAMLGDAEPPRHVSHATSTPTRSQNPMVPSLSSLATCDAAALATLADSPPVTVILAVSTVPVSAPGWPASRVAIAVAGTGYDSRMYKDLRQEKGWTYGAGMPVHYRPTYTVGLARTRVPPLHAVEAAHRLDAALASLRSKPPLLDELAQAKRFLVDNYWDNRENPVYEVAYLANFIGAGMTLEQFEQYPERLAGVSAAEVGNFTPAVLSSAIVVPVTGPSCRVQIPSLVTNNYLNVARSCEASLGGSTRNSWIALAPPTSRRSVRILELVPFRR